MCPVVQVLGSNWVASLHVPPDLHKKTIITLDEYLRRKDEYRQQAPQGS